MPDAFFMPSPLLGAVSLTAESVFGPITNSIILAAIVCGVIIWFVRGAMKKATLIPNGRQNFIEWIAEFLYNQTEAIVGKRVAPRAFPLLATIFIFVLVNNYFGLLPGIGTIGWKDDHHGHAVAEHVEEGHAATTPATTSSADASHGHAATADSHAKEGEHGDDKHKAHLKPWFRPASADLNFTLALALVFMVLWVYLTVSEAGVWGFLVHTFGPKGGVKGVIGLFLIFVFLGVGLIEMVSIAFRPVSLSLRLFGNIFAGETLLHAMGSLLESLGAGPVLSFIGKILLPLPFYFLELLVGVLQATVFTLLCAVYIQLSTAHDESHDSHGDEHGHGDGHASETSAPSHSH